MSVASAAVGLHQGVNHRILVQGRGLAISSGLGHIHHKIENLQLLAPMFASHH